MHVCVHVSSLSSNITPSVFCWTPPRWSSLDLLPPGVVVGRWRPAHRDSLSHSPQPAGAAAFSSYIIWGYATLGRLLACDLSGQWWSASRYSSWRRRGRGGRAGRRKRRRCGLQTQEKIEPAVFVPWLITSFVGKTKPSLFPQTHTYTQ